MWRSGSAAMGPRATWAASKIRISALQSRVLELSQGRIVRDEATGLYARDETTREFAHRMRSPSTRPPGIDLDPIDPAD